jgi:hypothetical protein
MVSGEKWGGKPRHLRRARDEEMSNMINIDEPSLP